MSLIECPECKGMVSDKALACPHCGYPIKEKHSSKELEEPIESDEQMDNYEDWEFPVWYCSKCGQIFLEEQKTEYCDVCASLIKQMPYKYSKNHLRQDSEEWEERIYQDLVYPSPDFDQDMFDHRDEILDDINRKYSERFSKVNKPKCPTCGSYDVYKLTHTSFFDFRTYGCKNCGHKW